MRDRHGYRSRYLLIRAPRSRLAGSTQSTMALTTNVSVEEPRPKLTRGKTKFFLERVAEMGGIAEAPGEGNIGDIAIHQVRIGQR